jgi:hypothetical protein
MTHPQFSELSQRMQDAGVKQGSAGWKIVFDAKLMPPSGGRGVVGDKDAAALFKLMKSFYKYGRAHWTWTQSSGGAAANGGLAKGTATTAACGTFNGNLMWLAEHALGIEGIKYGKCPDQFITIAGDGIDSKWDGNVECDRRLLPMYKFHGHYWVKHGGNNFDACFNRTFGSSDDIISTKLSRVDKELLDETGLAYDELYKLDAPIKGKTHLKLRDRDGAHGWPVWELLTKDEVVELS